MMSTPPVTRLESVREKRASAIFCTTSPIRIGIRSLNVSHVRPAAVASASSARTRTESAPIAGKITNQ